VAGLLSRLFGGGSSNADRQPISLEEIVVGPGWPDIEVSGEAHRRAEVARLFSGLGRPEGGVTMQQAHLVLEPSNPHDRNAVKVVIRGQHVGYVPAEDSPTVSAACRGLGRGRIAVAPARVWARVENGTWRARVTLAFSGSVEEEQDYADDRRRYEAVEAERAAQIAQKAAAREERDRVKQARRDAGTVRGEYWTTWKPSIAELKRQQRLEEARALLIECRDASEREARVGGEVPQPWPAEQLSAVLRRMGDRDGELVELERYVAACGPLAVPESVIAKLSKARIARSAD
jgi:hypothetical protein